MRFARLAFDADDAAPLGAPELATLAPEAWGELRFGLHPSAQLLPMRWNTVALWQALNADAPPPDPEPSGELMCWLVWRRAEQPHFHSLPAAEAEALRRISLGATFGEVCEAACAHALDDGDTMLALAGYLQHWLAQGVLVARFDAASAA